MADSTRGYDMEKAAFDQEVNAKKAEAQLAYQLQVCAYIYLTGLFLLNTGSYTIR